MVAILECLRDALAADAGDRIDLQVIGRLVDGLGAAHQDQRACGPQALRVPNEFVGRLHVHLHGRDQQHVQRPSVQPGGAGSEIGDPLLKYDPDVLEPGRVQDIAERTHRTRCHALVRVPVGQHPRAGVVRLHDSDAQFVCVPELRQPPDGCSESPVRQIHIPGAATW